MAGKFGIDGKSKPCSEVWNAPKILLRLRFLGRRVQSMLTAADPAAAAPAHYPNPDQPIAATATTLLPSSRVKTVGVLERDHHQWQVPDLPPMSPDPA
jgi:hypothetical protein